MVHFINSKMRFCCLGIDMPLFEPGLTHWLFPVSLKAIWSKLRDKCNNGIYPSWHSSTFYVPFFTSLETNWLLTHLTIWRYSVSTFSPQCIFAWKKCVKYFSVISVYVETEHAWHACIEWQSSPCPNQNQIGQLVIFFSFFLIHVVVYNSLHGSGREPEQPRREWEQWVCVGVEYFSWWMLQNTVKLIGNLIPLLGLMHTSQKPSVCAHGSL